VGDEAVDITYGDGVAFITGPTTEPFFFEYHSSTGTYSVHQITQEIRDFEAVQSTESGTAIATDKRPTVLDNTHKYNLLNQGWDATKYGDYQTAQGVYPSNADMWIYAKDVNDVFSPTLLDKQWFGNAQSAQGRYIYNIYNMNRSANATGLTGNNFSTDYRPSTCEFFAGRLFTAGTRDSKLMGTILFSRVIENADLHAGQCYQTADPTSEVFSDLRPDDGGSIKIPEAGAIYHLMSLGTGIAVFAQNGVWHIKGSSDLGFAADAFSLQKVTSVGCDSPKSIVEVEGSAMYWSKSGIYAISPTQSGLSLSANNITQTTIQSEFEIIPFNQISACKGVYDPLEREIKWFYALDQAPTYATRYTNKLTLDMRLQAFYKSSYSGVAGTNPHVVAPFNTLNSSGATTIYGTSIRGFCVLKNGATWDYTVAVEHSTTFKDWYTEDTVGVDYTSFLETGYELFGDAMRKKQIDYMFIYNERTELTATDGTLNNQSSCLMQYKFDWADNATSQKWTTEQEVYVYTLPYLLQLSPSNPGTENVDYGYHVMVKKEKVLGTGRAVQVRFTSSPGKDMRLLGWATLASGGKQP